MKDYKYEISTLLYMEHMINNSINQLITDRILRNKDVDYSEFKEHINYVLDEQIGYILRNEQL